MDRSAIRIVRFSAVLLLAACGQLAAKAGALRAGAGDLLNPLLLASMVCLVARALLWAAVLRHERLLFAYPVMALSYPLVLGLAWIAFGEPVTPFKVLSSTLIVGGILVMAVAETHP